MFVVRHDTNAVGLVLHSELLGEHDDDRLDEHVDANRTREETCRARGLVPRVAQVVSALTVDEQRALSGPDPLRGDGTFASSHGAWLVIRWR
jgi:hypothetical protein